MTTTSNEKIETNTAMNPFSDDARPPAMELTGAGASDSHRAIQEVQAAMVIAQRFPRNRKACTDDILRACTRPSLAEQALYSYSRGGQEVTGPSIRLAEAIAQAWRNLNFGIRELSQHDGESQVEAFSWDLETNTRKTVVFHVPHKRFTRKGSYPLTDPRDIYETVANNGARRLRNCILAIVPGDVIEAAQKQCEITLKSHADTSESAMKVMQEKFEDLQVSRELIEEYIGCRLDAIKPAQVVQLRKIYNSIKEGYSKPVDWFKGLEEQPEPGKSSLNETLKQKPEAKPETKPGTKPEAIKAEAKAEVKPETKPSNKP